MILMPPPHEGINIKILLNKGHNEIITLGNNE